MVFALLCWVGGWVPCVSRWSLLSTHFNRPKRTQSPFQQWGDVPGIMRKSLSDYTPMPLGPSQPVLRGSISEAASSRSRNCRFCGPNLLIGLRGRLWNTLSGCPCEASSEKTPLGLSPLIRHTDLASRRHGWVSIGAGWELSGWGACDCDDQQGLDAFPRLMARTTAYQPNCLMY